MKPLDQSTGDANVPYANAEADVPVRSFGGAVVGLLAVLLGAIIIISDYSDVIFSESGRREALNLIKPGMRLTQAERKLNSAGYSTLYLDASAPVLQVSSLSRMPLSADLLHRALPNSIPDVWLRSKLSTMTKFYVVGETTGMVKFAANGRPAFVRGRGDQLPSLNNSYFTTQ